MLSTGGSSGSGGDGSVHRRPSRRGGGNAADAAKAPEAGGDATSEPERKRRGTAALRFLRSGTRRSSSWRKMVVVVLVLAGCAAAPPLLLSVAVRRRAGTAENAAAAAAAGVRRSGMRAPNRASETITGGGRGLRRPPSVVGRRRLPRQVRALLDPATGAQTVHRVVSPSAAAVAPSGRRRDDGDGDDGLAPYLDPSDARVPNARSIYESEGCEPVHEWQLRSYPSCNDFHEVYHGDLSVINKGGSRIALELEDFDGTSVVLKEIKYSRKDFLPKHYEEQRKDALIMDATTKSPYIAVAYGYCGISVLTEYSEGGSLHDLIKGSRLRGGSALWTIDKLRVGYQLVRGVADLHGSGVADGTGPPMFAHNDICCHQYILVDGVFKLNDFNYADIARVDKDTGEQCLEWNSMAMWRGRGLEEFQYKVSGKRYKRDKLDVFMTGNLLYYVLTDMWLFEGESQQAAIGKIMAGKRSQFPRSLTEGADSAERALMEAIGMCWTHDPKERPNAQAVADFLLGKIRDIVREEVSGVVRAKVPPRDPKQRLTDSDYEKWNS